MIDSPSALLDALRARGLVTEAGPAEAPTAAPAARPWYIGLILGTAGWIAGIFVLAFVFMLFSGASIIGAPLLLAAAYGLYRVDREGAFVSQLALALSVAGQFLAVFWLGDAFFKTSRSLAGIAFTALLLQVVLLAVMPNRLHRTMSALFAVIAWAVFVRYGLWDDPFWGDSRKKQPLTFPLALAGWAIVWLPAAGLLYMLIRREAEWMAKGWQDIARPAAVGLIVALAITTLISQPFDTFPFGGSHQPGEGGLSIWPLLSTAAALGALAAAFALGNRGLAATCIVAALVHMSHFYYAMGTTLLTKSLTMIAAGVILLWTARTLRRPGPP